MPSRVDLPDLAFGLFLVAVGTAALARPRDLTVGSAGNMGPGYVPRGLALVIVLFGAGLAARALLAPAPGLSRRAAAPARC